MTTHPTQSERRIAAPGRYDDLEVRRPMGTGTTSAPTPGPHSPTSPATLRDVLAVLRRSWLLVAVTLAVSAGLGWLVSTVTPASYEATAKVMVSPVVSDGLPVSEGAALVSSQIDTYAALASTQVVLEPAAVTAGVPVLLPDDVDAAALPDTSIIEITGTASTAEEAAAVAAAVAATLIDQVQQTGAGSGEALVTGAVVEHPLVPTSPESPNLPVNLVVALAAGCVVALLAVVLRQALSAPRHSA